MPKGYPRNRSELNDLSTHLRTQPGLRDWYLDYDGELVDGPYASKAQAADALAFYREVWKGYYKQPERFTLRNERKQGAT